MEQSETLQNSNQCFHLFTCFVCEQKQKIYNQMQKQVQYAVGGKHGLQKWNKNKKSAASLIGPSVILGN